MCLRAVIVFIFVFPKTYRYLAFLCCLVPRRPFFLVFYHYNRRFCFASHGLLFFDVSIRYSLFPQPFTRTTLQFRPQAQVVSIWPHFVLPGSAPSLNGRSLVLVLSVPILSRLFVSTTFCVFLNGSEEFRFPRASVFSGWFSNVSSLLFGFIFACYLVDLVPFPFRLVCDRLIWRSTKRACCEIDGEAL